MMLSTFAKNRLFIKSFLSILMLLMLFCTPDALKANASFDTSVTTSFVPSEYLPLETEQATAVVRANKAFLPERGLNRETGFPLLTLLSFCSIRSARVRSGRFHGRISSSHGLPKSGACCLSPARRLFIGSPSFPLSGLACNAHSPMRQGCPNRARRTHGGYAPPWRNAPAFPDKRQGVLMDIGLKVVLICAGFMAICVVLGMIGKKLAE